MALAASLLAGCSSSSQPAASASPSGPSGSAASPAPDLVALTAAGCGEITRLTREEMAGLVDDDPTHWERFAVSLQSIANGSPDAEFSTAITAMATAALRTSESLQAGKPLGPALTSFEDTIPAVDAVCKRVGAPLN